MPKLLDYGVDERRSGESLIGGSQVGDMVSRWGGGSNPQDAMEYCKTCRKVCFVEQLLLKLKNRFRSKILET